MRIIVPVLVSDGGGLHYPAELVNALSAHAEVCVVAHSDVPRDYFNKKIRFFYCGRNLSLLSRIRYLNSVIGEIKPDLIRDPVGSMNIWSMITSLRSRRLPLIMTLHDPRPHEGIPFYLRATMNFLTARVAKRCTRIIVHGPENYRQAVRAGIPAEKLVILNHGAYTMFTYSQCDTAEEENTVLFFGELRVNKGIDILPEIARRVRREVPAVRFLVAGPAPKKRRSSFGRLDEILAGMQTDETFQINASFIPDADIPYWFRRSSLVLLPYHEATQSGIASLACAFGKPVVATNTGDLPVFVRHGETGFLAPPGDVDRISGHIITLLKDANLRNEFGARLSALTASEFSWGCIAEREISLYKEAIA